MKSLSVLIVEDEILIAETIKLYLQERGHVVSGIAISYEEAIQILEEAQPDIILLDIRLYGNKSGLDIAKYLMNSELSIPYIILSSQYDYKVIQDAMYAGAAGYLTKPISKESLWSTIELAVMKLAEAKNKEATIELKIGYDMQRIKLNEIIMFKSDHVYVKVIGTTKQYLCRYTLSEVLELIQAPYFVQCNRSYIINIRKISRYSSSKIWIYNEVLTIGPKYKEVVAERIGMDLG